MGGPGDEIDTEVLHRILFPFDQAPFSPKDLKKRCLSVPAKKNCDKNECKINCFKNTNFKSAKTYARTPRGKEFSRL